MPFNKFNFCGLNTADCNKLDLQISYSVEFSLLTWNEWTNERIKLHQSTRSQNMAITYWLLIISSICLTLRYANIWHISPQNVSNLTNFLLLPSSLHENKYLFSNVYVVCLIRSTAIRFFIWRRSPDSWQHSRSTLLCIFFHTILRWPYHRRLNSPRTYSHSYQNISEYCCWWWMHLRHCWSATSWRG